MNNDFKINSDLTDPTRFSWSATMTMGMGIVNQKPIAVLPITSEMRASIQAKADEAGMSFNDYFDMVIDEANSLDTRE